MEVRVRSGREGEIKGRRRVRVGSGRGGDGE